MGYKAALPHMLNKEKNIRSGLKTYEMKVGVHDPANADKVAFHGRTHTTASKRKIGKSNAKIQKGKGNSQYGTMWITNGIESKKILKTLVPHTGWRKGRIMPVAVNTKS